MPPGDKLDTIFNHQKHLMMKYHIVEESNLRRKLPDPENINLDVPDDQLRLKEFAWRITEELAESTECLVIGAVDETHFLEELIDALHFSVEFDMMSGIRPEDLCPVLPAEPKSQDRLDYIHFQWEVTYNMGLDTSISTHQEYFRTKTWSAVEALGKAMNTLKNKPWKSTHMVTDRAAYRSLVLQFNQHLFRLMWWAGLNPVTLTQLYLNKNAVNQFRIRSNY